MPPVAGVKSRSKKEYAEQQKRMLASREKVLKIKRELLAIVEAMLEKEVSQQWFLKHCIKLCHADYDDVIQERSIEHLCGYPLCSNTVQQTLKQKYHISKVTNKVYDLTERKYFCSNQCYKASNYLKAQLSPIPLYMRKEEEIKVNLLSDSNNRGSVGEEVVFHHTIPKEEIEMVYTVEQATNNFTNIINEEIKKCAASLSDLNIKEHVFEKQYAFEDLSPAKQVEDPADNKSESDANSEIDDDESEDEKLFPEHDNLSSLSHKHMPIPNKTNKTVLISLPKPNTSVNLPIQQLSLDFVFNVFKDWMTEDTMKYLLGEKYVYGVKADHLFDKMTATDSNTPDRLSSVRNEYINLCLKIDNLPDDDEILSDSADLDIVNISERKDENISKIIVVADKYTGKKTFKKRPKRSPNEKGKRVTFASGDALETNNISNVVASTAVKSSTNIVSSTEMTKVSSVDTSDKIKTVSSIDSSTGANGASTQQKSTASINVSDGDKNVSISVLSDEMKILNINPSSEKKTLNLKKNQPPLCETEVNPEESETSPTWPEPALPLIDSVSQNALRRQVLTSKLKSVYIDLLPLIGLHYTDVRESIKKFVDTLSLSPTNIMFKPKEWKLISLILLRILTRTVLKDLHDEEKLKKLCECSVIPVTITAKEIEKLVHDIISIENIITLPMLLQGSQQPGKLGEIKKS